VVKQLKVTLLGAAPKAHTTDPAADALHLQAVQLGRQYTAEAFQQSDAPRTCRAGRAIGTWSWSRRRRRRRRRPEPDQALSCDGLQCAGIVYIFRIYAN
jgi:hypothetical protein